MYRMQNALNTVSKAVMMMQDLYGSTSYCKTQPSTRASLILRNELFGTTISSIRMSRDLLAVT